MKINLKRIGCAVLAVAMLLTAVGCGSGGGGVITSEISTTNDFTQGASGGSSTVVTGGNSSVTSSQQQALEKAAKELDGYTFTIMSGWLTMEEDVDEHTPLMDRLFWEQAKKVEKEYGCDIVVKEFYPTANAIRPYIMAGKKVADLVETMPIWIPQNVAQGAYKAWNDVAGINLNDSGKWNTSSYNSGTYKNKIYGLQFLKPIEARYCVMFNKTLLEKNGVDADGLYKLVKNKKWTWDKLREYAIACTKDTNSDGINDTWGILGKYNYMANAFVSSFGGSLLKESGGKYKFNLNSSNSVAGLNYYNKLVNTDKCVWVHDQLLSAAASEPNEAQYYQKFNKGEGAFLIWESWVLNQYTKIDAKFEYGILPLPLGTGQKNYVSPSYNERLFAVTSTNKDLDKAVVVINALAEGFGDYNGDDWYEDVEADYFNNDAKQNLEMYKLILNSASVDWGLSIESLEYTFYDKVKDSIYLKNTTPAAAVDSIKDTYTDTINSVFN